MDDSLTYYSTPSGWRWRYHDPRTGNPICVSARAFRSLLDCVRDAVLCGRKVARQGSAVRDDRATAPVALEPATRPTIPRAST